MDSREPATTTDPAEAPPDAAAGTEAPAPRPPAATAGTEAGTPTPRPAEAPPDAAAGTEAPVATNGTEAGTPTPRPPSEVDRWAAFAPVPERVPGRLRRAAGALGRGLAHEWTLATAGALALAVAMTWPALRYPQYTLPQDLGDPTLVSWILSWPGHILLTDPTQLWHGNAFHPERWSYAFTDSLLGYAPAGMLGSGPLDAVLRYNILFVLVHALAFLGAYALVRQLGADRIAALVAGLAFAYAPWRLTQAGHLQVLSTGGIALALAMLARGHGWSLRYGWRKDKVRPGWIIAGWLMAAWQISLGFGIGLVFGYVLLGLSVAVLLTWVVRRIARRERGPVGRIVVANLVGAPIFASVTVLMALPYLTVADQHPQAQRDFAVLPTFSPPLQGYLTAPPESWLWGSVHADAREALGWPPEMALLPGFALIGLAVAGLFFSVWSIWARLLLAAGVVASVLLGLGTELYDGAAYRVLHEWLPGWDALRTPGRLVIWTTLLLGVLAAGAVSAFLARSRELALERGSPQPSPWLRLVALVPAVLVLAEGLNTTPHEVVPQQPAALAAVEAPVLVLPMNDSTNQLVMLWSTDGFAPVVNGSSGFMPDSTLRIQQLTPAFPSQESVSHLRSVGVETVVVLPDRVVGTEWEGALHATGDGLGITREEIDGVIVFHLGPG